MKKKKIGKEAPMFHGAKPRLFDYARILRDEKSTSAERILWRKLRGRKLGGYKFRRQHPLGKYIADFYCHEKKLIVEIDGGYHFELEQRELDEFRTEMIETLGIKVIRFTNDQIYNKLRFVLPEILAELESR